jgi:adenylate kinase
MHKYVRMGVQGSGKSTHSQMLAADLEIVHISMGDIFRWHVRNHTKTGAHIQRVMASGELLSDELVQSVIQSRLADHDWNFGFIIDGFPRNRPQAEFFLQNYDIDGVIVLDVPDHEVRRRVLNRRQCADCGTNFHLLDNPPTVSGKCDVCGGQLITREDDTEEALTVRLRTYHKETNPIIEVFQQKDYVVMVDARPATDAVQAEIMKKLGLPPAKVSHGVPGTIRDTQGPRSA